MQRKHFLATLASLALATTLPLAHAQDSKPLEWVGLQGFEGFAWQGLVVPTGAPADVVANFSKALQTALADTRTKARLQALGVEPMPGTAAQMGSFARTEREKWGRVITKVGVKLD
eukprot:gene2137-2091_t